LRMVCRLIGSALVFIAAGLLAYDLTASLREGRPHLHVLGELLFQLAPSFLNLMQAVIQRYVHPFVWDPVIQTLLLWWAGAVVFVPGFVLVFLCRRRERGLAHRRA
jgi:hypothetical protein